MLKRLTAVAAVALIAAAPAFAQDVTAAPNYGEVQLQAGFPNDPYTVPVIAGGGLQVSQNISHCVGYISEAPDFRLQYVAGQYPLAFAAVADGDTTLVINGADGQWYCDDDSGGDGDAVVVFNQPISGQYDIWVGSFGPEPFEATLGITEQASGDGAASNSGSQHSVQQFAGGGATGGTDGGAFGTVSLTAGFLPDPHTAAIPSGGPIDISPLGNGCVGWTADQADYRVDYSAGQFPLSFLVIAPGDTTLAILAPDGNMYCNDDVSGHDPGVAFDAPMSGTYMIWVGSFAQGQSYASTLYVTEQQ